MDKCKRCGKGFETGYSGDIGAIMVEHGVCFNCAFWIEKLAVKDSPDVVRVGGTHYWVEHNDTAFKGFGGAAFSIKWNDGRTLKCSNLWCQGDIPEHFREELPDNAVFV